MRRLTVEELAGRRVPLRVFERVDLVHNIPPSRLVWLVIWTGTEQRARVSQKSLEEH